MARYYASRRGRFMTPDPGHVGAFLDDPQSWNAYAYTLNDPVNFVDPTGLETECYVDGLPRDCGDALRLVNIGAADFCPNNICSGWDSEANAFKFFFAGAGGAGGYARLDELAYVRESKGDLLIQRPSDGPGSPMLTKVITYTKEFQQDALERQRALEAGKFFPPLMDGLRQFTKQATRGIPTVTAPRPIRPIIEPMRTLNTVGGPKWKRVVAGGLRVLSKAQEALDDIFSKTLPIMIDPCLISPYAGACSPRYERPGA